jgi:hypothetical protein
MADACLRFDNTHARPGRDCAKAKGGPTSNGDTDMPASAKPESTWTRNACAKAAIILGMATVLWLAWYCAASAAAGGLGNLAATLPGSAVVQRTGMSPDATLALAADPTRARLEQLSEREMTAFYTRCSRSGMAGRLDGGEAMACSIGYDILL